MVCIALVCNRSREYQRVRVTCVYILKKRAMYVFLVHGKILAIYKSANSREKERERTNMNTIKNDVGKTATIKTLTVVATAAAAALLPPTKRTENQSYLRARIAIITHPFFPYSQPTIRTLNARFSFFSISCKHISVSRIKKPRAISHTVHTHHIYI